MSTITVYTKNYCPYCKAAKTMLGQRGLAYTEIDVTNDPNRFAEMVARSRRRTVPQVFFGDDHIGGSEDLWRYLAPARKAA